MRRILRVLVILIAIVATICIVNVLRLPPSQAAGAGAPPFPIDRDAAAQRLAAAVRIATVSYEDRTQVDLEALRQFAAFLAAQFPRTHATLQREVVNGHSLLFTWPGANAAAPPMLLLAHLDVVPVEPGTEGKWTHPPFAGAIADGFVWGRGTLDDKGSVVATLEAVERLVASDFRPRRTVYLAFGHDEEIGGEQGATEIAKLLAQRGVKVEFSLDEGGAITQGVVAGVARPVASIMSAEKGYVTLRLTAHDAGGHSSRPPPRGAIGRIARAVARLEDCQMPARFAPPVTDMLERLAPEMPLARRFALANRWLFAPLLTRALTAKPVTAALVRTTTAPTIVHAGIKANVLPADAYAIVNFRILPGDSIAAVEQHVRRTIDDDGIEIAREGSFFSEPSPLADIRSPVFAALARTVNEVFPEAAVTTGLVIGATDNRHYGAVSANRYNFLPATLVAEDLARVHGANERIDVDAYARMIQFYERMLRNTAGPG